MAIGLLVTTATTTVPWILHDIRRNHAEGPDLNQTRVGTVAVQEDGGECELMTFDNDTGRTVSLPGRCHSAVVRDSLGIPIPMGTVHRLYSIRKSFESSGN
jgi:hypothetical protein